MRTWGLSLAALATIVCGAAPSLAQSPATAPPVPAAVAAHKFEAEIALNTGSVRGMPPETIFLSPDGKRTYRNISRATITPVLPKAGIATGAAILILPGGAFAMLSMDNEGWPVAEWFADHGIAAFVVKYRLHPTPAGQADFDAEMTAQYKAVLAGGQIPDILVPPQSVEDSKAALRYVRGNAQKYGVNPTDIGIVGFSAGALATLAVVATSLGPDQPAFIAPIYPPMKSMAVPASAPPMFVAIASDDPLFGKQGFGLVQAWQSAHKPVELHYYQKGGHGFGMGNPALTTSDWKESLLRWMRMNAFIAAR